MTLWESPFPLFGNTYDTVQTATRDYGPRPRNEAFFGSPPVLGV